MIISLPVMQTNNSQNQSSTTHPEPDKRTTLLRGVEAFIKKSAFLHASAVSHESAKAPSRRQVAKAQRKRENVKPRALRSI
jgi:hypothetical protein